MRAGWLIALAALGLLIVGGGVALGVGVARGLRNNNPGNIRKGRDVWQGMAKVQADPDFVTFIDPVYGLRALAVVLKNYRAKYGLNTVAGIIGRWAPETENDTGAYVVSVAKRMGVGAGVALPDNRATYRGLLRAIVRHENGSDPYSAEQVEAALDKAGIA